MATTQITHRTAAGRPTAPPGRRTPGWERTLLACLVVASVILLALAVSGACWARADAVAYLIEVTVRPGYHFADADAALTHGHQLSDKVSGGRIHADVIGDIKGGCNTSDDFQASCLIDKAVNELCPAHIWRLRNSAAYYPPLAG